MGRAPVEEAAAEVMKSTRSEPQQWSVDCMQGNLFQYRGTREFLQPVRGSRESNK
jgi:hypothetical protein